MKKIMFVVAATLSLAILASTSALGSHAPDDAGLKVWVCKYVGTPGVDETLKPGNDGLVDVSVNSLSGYSGVGSYFNDAQGRSFAIGPEHYANDNPGPAGTCPGGDTPPPTDVCPNIDGDQAEVPDGMVKDDEGNCVTPTPPPPTDVCPDVPGVQLEGPCEVIPPPPGDRCPPGMTPTAGKDGEPGNDECEFPETPTTPTETVTPPVVTTPEVVVTPPVVVTPTKPVVKKAKKAKVASKKAKKIVKVSKPTKNGLVTITTADGKKHTAVMGSG